jgi:hypothetical protein
LHKEFLVTDEVESAGIAKMEKPIFVTTPTTALCGVGLFTQTELQCSNDMLVSHHATVEKAMQVISGDLWINRGFGVELELVARVPSDERIHAEYEKLPVFQRKGSEMAWNAGTSIYGFFLRRTNSSNETLERLQNLGSIEDMLHEFGALELPALQTCFQESVRDPPRIGNACNSHSDCAATQFCKDCSKCYQRKAESTWGQWMPNVTLPDWMGGQDLKFCQGCTVKWAKICQPRSSCDSNDSVDGFCPLPMKHWQWTMDPSVHPLTSDEANALSSDTNEMNGTGFELISPGPPNVLSGQQGFHSLTEVFTVLRHMGVQAGPSSGMHVHVNVASAKAPGSILTVREIAYVWAAYAKYQLVIDEFLSPGRHENHYAGRLFLGRNSESWSEDLTYEEQYADPKQSLSQELVYRIARERVCRRGDEPHCARAFFIQMHNYLHSNAYNYLDGTPYDGTVEDFCNAALHASDSPNPCGERYPSQRYMALNLVPLARLGTVEFRAHSATNDPERALRWVQFVVAFVEHFGKGDGRFSMEQFFDSSDAEVDMAKLAAAQREARTSELFNALRGKISPSSEEFFQARTWEQTATGCSLSGAKPLPQKSEAQEKEAFQRVQEVLNTLGTQISIDDKSDEDGDE